MPIKVEEGKRYVLNNGAITEVMKEGGDGTFNSVHSNNIAGWWESNGVFGGGSVNSIYSVKSEYKEPKEEINAFKSAIDLIDSNLTTKNLDAALRVAGIGVSDADLELLIDIVELVVMQGEDVTVGDISESVAVWEKDRSNNWDKYDGMLKKIFYANHTPDVKKKVCVVASNHVVDANKKVDKTNIERYNKLVGREIQYSDRPYKILPIRDGKADIEGIGNHYSIEALLGFLDDGTWRLKLIEDDIEKYGIEVGDIWVDGSGNREEVTSTGHAEFGYPILTHIAVYNGEGVCNTGKDCDNLKTLISRNGVLKENLK